MTRLLRTKLLAATMLGLTAASGCALALDLVSPTILSGFGFDPDNVGGPPSKVIIAFTNDTDFPGTFVASVTDNVSAPDPTNTQLLSRDVEAGSTSSVVVECPVAAITPAAFGDGAGAIVLVDDTGAATAIDFAGSALISGLDFVCGDVIEIRAVESGGALGMFVRVLPGR